MSTGAWVHGTLAEDLASGEGDRDRRFQSRAVGGQVAGAEQAAHALGEAADRRGDVAAIEPLARGGDARDAMAAGRRVGLDEPLQRRGERRLAEQLADLGHAAAGIEDVGPARRVEVELRAALGDGQHAVHVLVHREAAARVVDGRREHLGERPGTPGLEQRQVGVDGARHGERQVGVRARAGRNAIEAPPAEEGHRGQLRRDALAADRDRLARASVVHERHALAAQRVGRGRLHDGRGEAGRHRRVDGVAAGQEHAHAGDGHQRVSGDDDALRPRDDGPRRRPVGRVMLHLVNAWQLVGHGGRRLPRQSWHSDTGRVKVLDHRAGGRLSRFARACAHR